MKKPLDILLAARDGMPFPGVEGDAWLLSIILDFLAPLERDCMDVLLLGDGQISTPDLAGELAHTLEQTGAALSRLRRLGLIETDHIVDELGRVAQHRAVAWVVEADRYNLERQRAAFRSVLEEIGV